VEPHFAIMAWNAPKPSSVIKRPQLSDLVRGPNGNSNTNELRLGLQLYHQWCTQLLTVRRSSVACITFFLSLLTLYLLTLPILLVHPSSLAPYLSLSGLWKAICIAFLTALAAYLRALQLTTTPSHSHSLYALALLPLFTFMASSLHAQWLFPTSPPPPSSLLALFCGYALLEHTLTINPLTFPSVTPRRSLFFKQLLVRLALSASLRAFVLTIIASLALKCPFTPTFALLSAMFALSSAAESTTRRLLTEKADLSYLNGISHPLVRDGSARARCIDCRLMALTHAHCAERDSPSERAFMARLALAELCDVVRFDCAQRKRMYATPAYLGVVVSALLAQLCELMYVLYEGVYGEVKEQGRARRRLEAAEWTGEEEVYCAGVVSWLVLWSLEEDELGVMQEWLQQCMCVLLEMADILDQRIKASGHIGTSARVQTRLLVLRKAMEAALARIIGCMHAHLGELKLPSKNAMRLMRYLDQH